MNLDNGYSLNGLSHASKHSHRFYPEASEIDDYKSKISDTGKASESSLSTLGAAKPTVSPGMADKPSNTPEDGDDAGFLTKGGEYPISSKRRTKLGRLYRNHLMDYATSGKINNHSSFLLHPDKATPDDIENLSRSAFLLGKQDNIDEILNQGKVIPFSGDLNLVEPHHKDTSSCFYSKPKNRFFIKKNTDYPLSPADFTHGDMSPKEFADYWKTQYFYVPELNLAEKYVESVTHNFIDTTYMEGTDHNIRSMMDYCITPNPSRSDRFATKAIMEFAKTAFSNNRISKDTRYFMTEKACNLVKLKLMKEANCPKLDIDTLRKNNISIEQDLRESASYDFPNMKLAQADVNKAVLKLVREYQEFKLDEYIGEAANIDDRMKPIIAELNRKGYKTKYSSPGYNKERKKNDNNRDGVYYNKLYTTARLMFDGNYNFPPAPKHWVMRDVEGNSYLDVRPITYDCKDGNAEDAFAAWKERYIGTLERWVHDLPDRQETVDGFDSSTDKHNKKVLEAASRNPYSAMKTVMDIKRNRIHFEDNDAVLEHCMGIVDYWKAMNESMANGEMLDEVDMTYWVENAEVKAGKLYSTLSSAVSGNKAAESKLSSLKNPLDAIASEVYGGFNYENEPRLSRELGALSDAVKVFDKKLWKDNKDAHAGAVGKMLTEMSAVSGKVASYYISGFDKSKLNYKTTAKPVFNSLRALKAAVNKVSFQCASDDSIVEKCKSFESHINKQLSEIKGYKPRYKISVEKIDRPNKPKEKETKK